MRCRSGVLPRTQPINGSPKPRRIELYAGRGRKENASAVLARGRGRRQAAEADADLRSKYADSPRKLPTQNGCDVIEFQLALPRISESPYRGESNSVQGAGVKQTLRQRRVGRAFPMAAQAETASRNPHSEWDAFSGWAVGGKLIPESALRTGRAFPTAVQAESSSRNPASNWDALSAPSPQLQNLCALHSKTG